MERKPAFGLFVLLFLGLSFSVVSILPISAIDWPLFHRDLEHKGTTPESVSPPLVLLWNYTTGNDVYSSPAVSGGVVYIGSFDNRVYGLNASTGVQIWNYTADKSIESSPAVSDGVVYVGSYDNRVYGLNASTGVQIWNYTTGWNVRSSPAVSGGVVYIGSFDNRVYGLNASTGVQIWNYTTGDWVMSSPAVSDGVVYVGSYDNRVYGLNASTGVQIWNYTTGDRIMSSPAVSDGVVYIGSFDTRVYGLNASTGVQIWNHPTGGYVRSSPAVSGGIVYVGSVDNRVYGLNASTGVQIWKYTTGSDVYSSPAVSGGVVYVGSVDNRVYGLNASTGVQIWNYTTGDRIMSSPSVSGGVIYIGSVDNGVYAFTPGSLVTFSSLGLSGDASGTVLTVDGFNYSLSDLPETFIWLVSSSHSFEWTSDVSAGSGRRYVWTGATGLSTARSSSIVVPETISLIQASYKIQYYLTVNSFCGTPTGEGWYDAGSEAAVSVESVVPMEGILGTLAARWVFSKWTGGINSTNHNETIVMDQPKQVIAAWTEDYTMLGVIAATFIAAPVVAAAIRKKK